MSPINVAQHKIDDLGEFILRDTKYFKEDGTWNGLFNSCKGPTNFHKNLKHLQHSASRLLHKFSKSGVPVLLKTRPWTLKEKDLAMARGNHLSARQFTEFLRIEMGDMRKKGIFIVIPYDLVRHLDGLRLSPMGVVPQRNRRPRTIIDYSYSNINQATHKLTPQESMQWGRTLQRILWYIYYADRRHGPVMLSKTDLSDGFYQLHLSPSGALQLAMPFPSNHGESPLVAVLTRLPIDWTESPPAFSAATETIADITNQLLEESLSMPPSHPLETLASTPVPIVPSQPDPFRFKEAGPIRPPLAYVDVYLDDFIKVVQGWYNALRTRRTLFHAIDSVFRPNGPGDYHRKEPNSRKKLLQGDAFWSTQKIILGWFIDTLAMTITLPQHRQDRLLELLQSTIQRKSMDKIGLQKLLGELRSMALALPGSHGCFSFLQDALSGGDTKI